MSALVTSGRGGVAWTMPACSPKADIRRRALLCLICANSGLMQHRNPRVFHDDKATSLITGSRSDGTLDTVCTRE